MGTGKRFVIVASTRCGGPEQAGPGSHQSGMRIILIPIEANVNLGSCKVSARSASTCVRARYGSFGGGNPHRHRLRVLRAPRASPRSRRPARTHSVQSEFRNATSASLSGLDIDRNAAVAASASPPCQRMVSTRLRARPSCRNRVCPLTTSVSPIPHSGARSEQSRSSCVRAGTESRIDYRAVRHCAEDGHARPSGGSAGTSGRNGPSPSALRVELREDTHGRRKRPSREPTRASNEIGRRVTVEPLPRCAPDRETLPSLGGVEAVAGAPRARPGPARPLIAAQRLRRRDRSRRAHGLAVMRGGFRETGGQAAPGAAAHDSMCSAGRRALRGIHATGARPAK